MNFGKVSGSPSSLVSIKHHFSRGLMNSLARGGTSLQAPCPKNMDSLCWISMISRTSKKTMATFCDRFRSSSTQEGYIIRRNGNFECPLALVAHRFLICATKFQPLCNTLYLRFRYRGTSSGQGNWFYALIHHQTYQNNTPSPSSGRWPCVR